MAFTAVAALLLAAVQGPVLFTTVVVAMAIGTAYSCRPLRLKRFPFWAAVCIVGVRGAVVILGKGMAVQGDLELVALEP